VITDEISLPMKGAAHLTVVTFVPFPAFGAPMPHDCGCKCAGAEGTRMAAMMIGLVCRPGFEFEVAGPVVAPVPIFVMDVKRMRNRAVRICPHDPMKTDAIALKILAAQVVTAALKLLSGCRKDFDHWIRCVTAS
jgi:hypothetical protein